MWKEQKKKKKKMKKIVLFFVAYLFAIIGVLSAKTNGPTPPFVDQR